MNKTSTKPAELEPILILPDCHVPFEDKRAFDLVLEVGKFIKPKHLVLIGDFADFYAVSSHSRNPLRRNQLPAEIMSCNARLDQLDALGATNKLYVEGNHEDRLRRYLQDHAPEMFGIVSVKQLFQLSRRGWTHIPYQKHGRIGKLYLTHDTGTAGRNSTFKAIDTYQHSVVIGHSHRMQYVVEGNAVGEFKLGAQFGWLGDRNQVDYMQVAKVNSSSALGFGIGYLNPSTGIVYLQPVPIVNGTCVVNGRLFNGNN